MACLSTLSINLKSDVLSKVNSAVLKVARQTWAFLVAYSKDPTKKNLVIQFQLQPYPTNGH